MKSLLLMRHAKSSWKNPDLSDHERPLKKRGKRDAPRMGEMLKEMDLVPQIIISSTAVRAVQTAEMVAETCGYEDDILYKKSYYHADPEAYIDVLRELFDNYDTVMVIGHNPGLEGLLQILSDEIESLSTASIAHITLPIDSWDELNGQSSGNLENLWRPKDIMVA